MLKCVLEEFLQIEGVATAALIARDGFLIEYVGNEPTDKDALAVLGSCAMEFFSRVGSTLHRGNVRQFVSEHDDGAIMFTKISDDEYLVIITGKRTTAGHLAHILPKISSRITAVM
jgi:predicted regulator of Ras-like GTPase activity (Roadblock/LC7/MglB family)